MKDSSTTAANLDQADEDILTCEVADDALEAAADNGRTTLPITVTYNAQNWCC